MVRRLLRKTPLLGLSPHGRWRLEQVWQGGQDASRDAAELLDALEDEHGPLASGAPKDRALAQLLSVALWEARMAWRVSARLSLTLRDQEARLAATAQALDEARHVVLLQETLSRLGHGELRPGPRTRRALRFVGNASSPARALTGLNLMLEPVALTFYRLLQDRGPTPAMVALLRTLEADEARHVALGLGTLPPLIKHMGPLRKADLVGWQLRLFLMEMQALKEMEPQVRALGFDPIDVLRLGHSKQLFVVDLITRDLADPVVATDLFNRVVDLRRALDWHGPEDQDPVRGLAAALRRAL
jgi:hypothetical protein